MGAQNQRALNSYILQFEQVAALSKQLEEPDIERNLNLTIEVLSELCEDKSCAGGEQEQLSKVERVVLPQCNSFSRAQPSPIANGFFVPSPRICRQWRSH